RFRRSGLHILDRRALAPLRDGLGVDTQLPAQLRERSLRSLYCCSDGVRGRGAAMTNLSQSASFHSRERIAPSNRGIKQTRQVKGALKAMPIKTDRRDAEVIARLLHLGWFRSVHCK